MRQAYSLLSRAYAKLGQSQLAHDALKKEQELDKADEQRVERARDAEEGLILVAPERGEEPPPSPPVENHP
jgi:predicted Zn-dependent protease